MNIEDAIRHAAAELPDSYIINISVEKGSAWVDFTDPCGDYVGGIDGLDKTLAEQVIQAVSIAKAEALK